MYLDLNTAKKARSKDAANRYFSLKVATDRVFCNRETELKVLTDSITANEHVVVVAPRRYGKTSLIMRAITVTNQPYAMIDLFCVSYQEEVARKLAKAVTEITRQFMGKLRKKTKTIFDTLDGIFRSANISFKSDGLEVSLDFSQKQNPVNQIEDLLSGLEKLARKMNKKAILFMDEFQDILKTDDSNKIQSAIRSIAQHSKNITYLFSGSSRTMLSTIFEDANQPLYLMCRKILLKRITANKLSEHTRHAWMECNNQDVNDETMGTILDLTKRHTYYYNHLCLALISNQKTIDPSSVSKTWDRIVDDEIRKIVSELQSLTPNQIKVLTHVSLKGTINKPNSQEFLNDLGMPLSSLQRSISSLLDADYLFKDEHGALTITDPAIHHFLYNRFEG